MTELIIDRDERLKLRAQSHDLASAVLLGQNGLTEAVLKEIDKAMNARGLVKIRIPGDDREARSEIIARILDQLNAALIQAIGKTVTVWRPIPEQKNEEKTEQRPDREARKPRSRGGKILKTDKKRLAQAKKPVRRAHPKRGRLVKKAMGAKQ